MYATVVNSNILKLIIKEVSYQECIFIYRLPETDLILPLMHSHIFIQQKDAMENPTSTSNTMITGYELLGQDFPQRVVEWHNIALFFSKAL